MTNKNQPFTAELAWTLIEQMEWSKQADYKEIAEKWFKKLGKAGMRKLEKFVGDRVSQLGAAVSQYEADPAEGGSGGGNLEVGSDDGFSDLRYHIVGMGQQVFDEALRDPQVMQTRYRQGNYKESFAYCFMQPDPPRTKKQKAATLAKLLAEIERADERLAEIKNLVGLLQMQQTSISLLAGTVKMDQKSN